MEIADVWVTFGCQWGEIRERGEPDLEGSYLPVKKF